MGLQCSALPAETSWPTRSFFEGSLCPSSKTTETDNEPRKVILLWTWKKSQSTPCFREAGEKTQKERFSSCRSTPLPGKRSTSAAGPGCRDGREEERKGEKAGTSSKRRVSEAGFTSRSGDRMLQSPRHQQVSHTSNVSLLTALRSRHTAGISLGCPPTNVPVPHHTTPRNQYTE